MYNPIKDFLNVTTWHTGHPLDKQRFYVALSNIIDNPDFTIEKLRVFMLTEKNLLDEGSDNSLVKVIDTLIREADVIYEYKKAIRNY